MSTTTLSFGTLSIRTPAFGPLAVARASAKGCELRLGYDPGLGAPLLVGVTPAALLGTPDAVRCARYQPWDDYKSAPFNSGVNLCRIELDNWDEAPDGRWAVFLLHGQPPNFLDIPSGILIRLTFLPLREAITQWWRFHDNELNPSDEKIDALRKPAQVAEQRDLAQAGKERGTWACFTAPGRHESAQETQAPTRFVLACCQYPHGILDGTPSMPDARPAPSGQSLARIRDLTQDPGKAPAFALLVGDQVYVDATRGLFDPSQVDERLFGPYRPWLQRAASSQGAMGAFVDMPIHAMPDDHEIMDDWQPVAADAQGRLDSGDHADVPAYIDTIKRKGLQAYQAFLAPDETKGGLGRRVGTSDAPDLVFLADTRTERQLRHAGNVRAAAIMGDQQWQNLNAWLDSCVDAGPRFLAGPAMVLPRVQAACGNTPASALRSDAWDGYPGSLYRLLAKVCELQLTHLVLLSGDAHLANITRIHIARGPGGSPPGSAREAVIHSVHAPALYAPYPFANAKPRDFNTDGFSFEIDGSTYACKLDCWFPAQANGFAIIESRPLATPPQPSIHVTLSFQEDARLSGPPPGWLANSGVLAVEIDTSTPTPTPT